MAAKQDNKAPAPQMKQKANGYKLRTTNDLLLLSMILDDNLPLRERVLRFMEAQLGKEHAGKSKE